MKRIGYEMLKKWKTINSEWIFRNKWYNLRKDVVELPNGRIVDDYFVSVREEVALVFPLTSDQKVILVRQYKHGIGEVVTELPGGFFDQTSEKAETAALRELREETGYSAGNITKLASFSDNPTKDTNHLHFFLAMDCTRTSEQMLDENETIELLEVPLSEIKTWVTSGKIKVTGSAAGILLALDHLGSLCS